MKTNALGRCNYRLCFAHQRHTEWHFTEIFCSGHALPQQMTKPVLLRDDQIENSAVEIPGVEIPQEYSELCEFIEENKQMLLSDSHLMFRILRELNNKLTKTQDIADLHQDSQLVLSAVKIQYDSLLRAYQNDLTIDKLVELQEQGALDEFYQFVRTSSFFRAGFVDQLDFGYSSRIRKAQSGRRAFENSQVPASVPSEWKEDSAKMELSKPIQRIRAVVCEHGRVEYFRLLVDPGSFSKTVYNTFNLALAIREKAVSLALIDGAVFVFPYTPPLSDDVDHSVIRISSAQYNRIVKRLGIQKPML